MHLADRVLLDAGTTPGFGAPPAQSCYTIGETLRPPRTIGVELQIRF